MTVVARGPDGQALAQWHARAHWVGALPIRFHGVHAGEGWTWSDPAARDTRIRTHADGSGGISIEDWAARHHATAVDVTAVAIESIAFPQPPPNCAKRWHLLTLSLRL